MLTAVVWIRRAGQRANVLWARVEVAGREGKGRGLYRVAAVTGDVGEPGVKQERYEAVVTRAIGVKWFK